MAIIYSLFGDDIRIAFTMLPADFYFNIVTFIVLLIFLLEILIVSILNKNYLFSFFFWLDTISSISMILDITFINDAVFGTNNNSLAVARAGRAARVGTRYYYITKIKYNNKYY